MSRKKEKSTQKIRYEVDPLNQLVMIEPFSPISPLRKKMVVEGKFEVDNKNNLSYYICSRQKKKLDEEVLHKIDFEGKWSLDENHDLKFSLDESKTQVFGDSLVIKGDIINKSKDSLGFSYLERISPNKIKRRQIDLKGLWNADKNNRLNFSVSRETGSDDKLIFNNTWQVSKNNELFYTYLKRDLNRKIKSERSFGIKGYWQIYKERLVYKFLGNSKSQFEFSASLETANLYPDDNKIKYQIGIKIKTKDGQKDIKKDVVLFGALKIKRDLSIDFEMGYPNKKVAIQFIVTRKINRDNSLSLILKDHDNEPIGLELILTRKFLKTGEFFLEVGRAGSEKKIEAGVRIPF